MYRLLKSVREEKGEEGRRWKVEGGEGKRVSEQRLLLQQQQQQKKQGKIFLNANILTKKLGFERRRRRQQQQQPFKRYVVLCNNGL